MARKNFFRKTRPYNNGWGATQQRDKNYYKGQLKKILISIIIVLLIIGIKKINTDFTKEAVDVVKRTINYDVNFIKYRQKFFSKTSWIGDKADNLRAVFNMGGNSEVLESQYLWPVKGTLYKKFGISKKSNGMEVLNKGIDIEVTGPEVVAAQAGIVLEYGQDPIYGLYVKVLHGSVEALYYGFSEVYVAEDDRISKGQLLGYIDEDKRKVFHFEIWENDEPVDPLIYLNESINGTTSI